MTDGQANWTTNNREFKPILDGSPNKVHKLSRLKVREKNKLHHFASLQLLILVTMDISRNPNHNNLEKSISYLFL